jgi:hypothetical protein
MALKGPTFISTDCGSVLYEYRCGFTKHFEFFGLLGKRAGIECSCPISVKGSKPDGDVMSGKEFYWP